MAKRTRGLGSVREKNSRFEARVQIDGRRLSKFFDRECDGWNWIATTKTDALRGVLKIEEKRKPLRFDDLCRIYLLHKEKRKDWRPDSERFFRGHAKSTLIPHFGTRTIDAITAAEIQGFLDESLERVSDRTERVISPTTVSKYQQILTQLFNFAVRLEYLDRSPMTRVDRVRPARVKFRVLRVDELHAIVTSCPDQDRALITLLMLTGIRTTELFRFSWDWCDFDNDRLLIKIAKRGSQELPMPRRVKEALVKLGRQSSGLVFPGSYRDRTGKDRHDPNKQLTDLRRPLERVLKAAGIEPTGITLRTFRRSYCTLLDEIGAPEGVRRDLARHSKFSSSDMTPRYLFPAEEQLRYALAQLEARIFDPPRVIPSPLPARRRPAPCPIVSSSGSVRGLLYFLRCRGLRRTRMPDTKKLSLDEIKRAYPDEWVILVDLDADEESDEVYAGVVFAHSKNERELLATTKDALAGKSSAVLFTGELAAGNYLF